jgi:hypothetical protein
MAKLIVRIPKNPLTPRSVTVEGVKGESCKDLTAGIEKALGAKQADTETEEYYQTEQVEEQQLLEGGGE